MDRALFFDQPGVGLSADYLWGGDQEEVDFVHVPLLLIAARLRLFGVWAIAPDLTFRLDEESFACLRMPSHAGPPYLKATLFPRQGEWLAFETLRWWYSLSSLADAPSHPDRCCHRNSRARF